ncbi:MAG: hypothetical protein B7Y88_10395 [Sphingomonadales bacterium 32-64-17]|nr:MAG: hypothetical protein B7Y88_10395 [Sphingomonadales bacterium 32-64-17]
MDDLELASKQPDAPSFLRAIAVHLVDVAIEFLVDIQFIEPIFDLEAALALLDNRSAKARPFFEPDIGNDEVKFVQRTAAAENINDAILLLKAIGEGQAIPHLKKAFTLCLGTSLVPERSSYLHAVLVEYPIPFAEPLVAAAEQRWATINCV